jgi:hypothetical protein
MNFEYRMSKERILFILKIERAQRFHPPIFCSWTFDILRFAVQIFYGEATLILVLIERLSVEDLCHLKY